MGAGKGGLEAALRLDPGRIEPSLSSPALVSPQPLENPASFHVSQPPTPRLPTSASFCCLGRDSRLQRPLRPKPASQSSPASFSLIF